MSYPKVKFHAQVVSVMSKNTTHGVNKNVDWAKVRFGLPMDFIIANVLLSYISK